MNKIIQALQELSNVMDEQLNNKSHIEIILDRELYSKFALQYMYELSPFSPYMYSIDNYMDGMTIHLTNRTIKLKPKEKLFPEHN